MNTKIRKRLKQNRKITKKHKTIINKFNKFKGGMHKLIGQGTHGKIYRKNNSIVIKEFENRPMPQDCLCSRFKNNCKSLCDHIHYEFIIQEFLYNAINQELHQLKIKIPKAYNFALSTNNTMCHYEMDYIHS
jgi:hypothetical protein